MRLRQVPLWSQLAYCDCYFGECTVHRRADVQIRQAQILELQLEVDVCHEEVRKHMEEVARLEASLRDIAKIKKTLEDV